MEDQFAPYRKKLAELVAQRDELNAQVADLQARKVAAADEAQRYNNLANDLAAQVQAIRGGQSWIDLKKLIGALSKMLSGK